ncbi:NAD(P)-binding protein [Mytilinidion resinicola]|uniref:NAD(P)-binding protein n=1 Tax=Mytilinidion resinicola TaxID=574789 RepID=A0A6A6Z2E5_9PEZI|nr:NAD(P)-binding protein [Mytilinidion resinicola]KAF2815332.1 NAD(P)-binding protein [Mytilinidion resinicola]
MANTKGTVLITGANGGLGSAFASQFLASPEASLYTGLFGVRNPATATTLQSILSKSPNGKQHEAVALDISTLASVRAGAKAINDRVSAGALPPIRALILNAAIQHTGGQTFTSEGLEETFAVNYLSNFLLILLLLQSMDKESGRIVIISSWTHDPLDPRNNHVTDESHKTIFSSIDALAKPPIEDREGAGTWALWGAGMRRYGMSKTLMAMLMPELQRRIDADPALSNISVLSVDPGGMPTGIVRHSPLLIRIMLIYVLPLFTPLMGLYEYFVPNGTLRRTGTSAKDVRRAAFDVKEPLGRFPKAVALDGSAVGAHQTAEALDEKKQKELWAGSLKYSGLKGGETVLKNWE